MERISELLFTFLVNALWQISAVTAVAVIANRAMRTSPARFRHLLWVAALIAALVLPFASVTRPSSDAPLLLNPWPPADRALLTSTAAHDSTSAPADAHSASIHFSPAAGTVVITLYFLTLLWSVLRLAAAWRSTQRLRAAAEVQTLSPALALVWEKCLNAFRLREVELRCAAALTGPVTLGTFRPVVIIPARYWNESSEDVLLAALGHELAHVARRDFAANLLYELLYLPLAFHPAAWLLRRQIQRTREMACDEAVVSRIQEPRAYARSILRIAEYATARTAPGCSLGIFDGAGLEDRLRRILRGSLTSARRARLLLAASVSALTLAVIMASAVPFSARAQTNVKEHLRKGAESYNNGDFREAARQFTAAVSLDPQHLNARLYLANALMRDYYGQK